MLVMIEWWSGEIQGKAAWKLKNSFFGSYRNVTLTPNNAEVVLVEQPLDLSNFVALDIVFQN